MPPKNAKKPKKAANGYKLPDPLPEGLIISNVHTKKSWRIGKSIGVGGFGEIYLCHEDKNKAVGDDAPFAVKIEPHENGPLFVEMNFYIRAAKPEMVESFVKAHKLQHLGMPVLRGNGSHTHKSKSYRFLVMDRFGKDLEKVFQNGKNVFSLKTSFNLAIKTLDVLEYIHSQGYVHNDIKAQNLLLGYGRAKENNVFLVDFGLVCKYQRGEIHLEYKPDARKAHDGTIEYTSRDAHIGTHSRRSDLEILGYNLIHWMSGNLPWMDNLSSPQYVHTQKKKYMDDIPAFLQFCFGENDYPDELKKFMGYTASLEFDTCPDYDKCRDIFKGGLKKRGYPLDGKIDFLPSQSPGKKVGKQNKPIKLATSRTPKNKSTHLKKKSKDISEDEDEIIDKPKSRQKKTRKRIPSESLEAISMSSEDDSKKSPPSTPLKKRAAAKGKNHKRNIEMIDAASQTSPAFVKAARAAKRAKLESNKNEGMDKIVKKDKAGPPKAKSKRTSPLKRKVSSGPSTENPTAAMLAIMKRKEEKSSTTSKKRAKKI